MTDSIELPAIHFQTYIAVSPERVYDTITTGEGWDAWFTNGAEVEPRPGGRMIFRWKDWGVNHYSTSADGPVLEAERPARFVFQWTAGDTPTTIEFDLKPLGSGTHLSVRESGHTTSKKDLAQLVECSHGWGEACTLLKFYLEHDLTYGEVPRE